MNKTLQEFSLDKCKELISKNTWTFAKTMPETPHEYIVRNVLSKSDKKLFDDFKARIDQEGYSGKFRSNSYLYLNIGNYKYWVIDNILNREKNSVVVKNI